jgi:glycerol-3-phosphate responsive antiterminator
VKGNKELTFIMILPLQMFDITQVSDQNQMSPVYLFIQIQILIGFQPNRFVTKYSQKNHQSYRFLFAI